MKVLRIAMLLSSFGAGSAFAADKPPCALLTRPQVQAVAGAGTVKAQYDHPQLPPLSRNSKELVPVHVCNWAVQETQSAVEAWFIAKPLDDRALESAYNFLSRHSKKDEEDAQQFGDVSCWVEALPQKLQPNAVCVSIVHGNVLKVLMKSRTVKPTTQQAKTLFDEAAAGL